jgi:hypothetical protein
MHAHMHHCAVCTSSNNISVSFNILSLFNPGILV